MSDGPKPPSDEELDQLLNAMNVDVKGEMRPPEEGMPKPPPPEVAGRLKMLAALHDLIQGMGETARLSGFVFVGVCEDGVTPVLYSVQTMSPIAGRLLIAEIQLVKSRLTRCLNDAEDYVPQDGERDES